MTLKSGLPDGVYERDQSEKQYYKVLVVGGYGAQSSEINEIQQIQDSQRDMVTSSLYPEGTIISGGFASQDSGTNVVLFKESRIHLKEYIFILPSAEIETNPDESSTIGVILTENYIGSDKDPELLNPVEGTANFGTKGAMRIQYLVSWAAEPKEDLSSNQYYYPLYSTLNGKVIITQSKTSSEIYDTIARYDNDSNGSYIISGMKMYYTKDEGNYHVCGITEGVAHVNGYEVVYSYANPVNITKAIDTFSRISEPVSISGSGTYKTRHSPIAEVSRVLITKQKNLLSFTHGGYLGARDSLTKSNPNGTLTLNSTDSEANVDNITAITKVISISSDSAGTNKYVTGRDYVMDGDIIDWSPSGQEPSPGSTYYVSLQYLTTDVNYEINEDRTGVIITDDYIASGEWCAIDYTHYLQRIDSVVLYGDGSAVVVKGAPSESNPIPQSVSGGLTLSTVLVRYGYEPYFYNDFFKAVKMSDILDMKNAISELQNNFAQLDLKTDISSKDPATTRAGMFVDPFFDNDQRDQGLTQNAEIVEQTLYPLRNWLIFDVHTGADITLPRKADVNLINQKYRTKSRKINEFNVSPDLPIAYMTASPSVYRWTTNFTNVSKTEWAWTNNGKYKNYRIASGGVIETYTTSVSTSDTTGVYTVPTFNISISGTNFNANETIKVSIDSINVGTFTANSSGAFSGNVTTPSGMKSGTKRIIADGVTSLARAVTTISTIPQTETRYVTTVYSYGIDPIGQTFVNNEDCLASSVKLMFSKVPNSFVELRMMETSSGYPDPTKVIGSKVLQKNQISTSGWTTFKFDSPVFLEANKYYAIAALCTENIGEVYTAELGKRDTYNNVWMTQNVFPTGTLVQASQEYTWSAVQTEDLTFQIDRCNFQSGTHEIDLGTVTIDSENPISQVCLLADSEVFSGTSLEYKLTLDGDSGIRTVSQYSTTDLGMNYSGGIKVSASLTTEVGNEGISPKIGGDIQLAGAIPQYPSEYISRAFPTDGKYMKIYLDTYETGTQIYLQYQDVSTGTWYDMDIDTILYPPQNLGDGWVTKTYYKNIGSLGEAKGNIRVKIRFNNSESSTVSIPACKNLRVLTSAVES